MQGKAFPSILLFIHLFVYAIIDCWILILSYVLQSVIITICISIQILMQFLKSKLYKNVYSREMTHLQSLLHILLSLPLQVINQSHQLLTCPSCVFIQLSRHMYALSFSFFGYHAMHVASFWHVAYQFTDTLFIIIISFRKLYYMDIKLIIQSFFCIWNLDGFCISIINNSVMKTLLQMYFHIARCVFGINFQKFSAVFCQVLPNSSPKGCITLYFQQ